jgi:hypothetical protein
MSKDLQDKNKSLIQTLRDDGKQRALRYIDGWITNKMCQNLTKDAKAILEDMRVHIRAADERLKNGEPMEATTPLADD